MTQEEFKLKKSTFVLILTMFVNAALVSGQNLSGQDVVGMVSRLGDTTHFEFKGRKDWQYESPVKNGDIVTVILPAFNDETVTRLENWTCSFIKKIEVNKDAPDGRYELKIQLTSNSIESFDYQTDEPSDLIIDFYQQPSSPKTAAVETDTTKEQSKKANKKSGKRLAKNVSKKSGAPEEYKKLERSPAGSELISTEHAKFDFSKLDPKIDINIERGVFDGSDKNYDRFRIKNYQFSEAALIASKQNIYIHFPVLELKLNRFGDLMKLPPVYEIKPQETSENKEARFLLTLFERKKWGSFFETLKYFNTKYPNSQYDEIVKNMTAEAYIHLYQRDKNPNDLEAYQSLYTFLIETYPDSVLSERNNQLLIYSFIDNGKGLESIRLIQKYLEKFPKSVEKDRIRLAMGEAYQLMSKPEDAKSTYAELNRTADDKNLGVEAAFRVGDVLMIEKKYSEAIESYAKAAAKYPEFNRVYPNAAYNTAEAKFWLNQHRESLDAYIEFLRLFPTHKYGGYALTRIGELLEVMGAPQPQIMGAFIEGYFRFPDSAGSEVSRLRMLSQSIKIVPEREKKRTISEIDEITKKSKLPRIEEFSTLLKAEGYSRRKNYDESLNLLISYYQENPTTADLNVFKSRILRNISDIFKEQVAEKKYIDVLNMYGKYSKTWLKNANRLDATFYQAIAYEKSDVKKEAEKLYTNVLTQLQKMAGTTEEKEKRVLENLPSIGLVQLRLAAIALSDRRYRDSYNRLNEIKNPLDVENEIEKIQMLSEVSENMNDLSGAVANLETILKLYPDRKSLTVNAKLKLLRILTKQGRLEEAEKYLVQLEEQKKNGELPTDEMWAQTLELKGDLLFKKGQKIAAVETYATLLESFENRIPLSAVRYQAGKILFDQGDLNGAEKFWSGFDSKMGQFYQKLAAEKMSQAQWQDNYKKYINRIPAAENLR